MKICLINNLFKPYERGGADRVAEIVCKGLERRGHDVFSISLRPFFSKPKNNPARYYFPSVFFNLSSIPKIFRLIYHIWDFFNVLNFFKIVSILKKEKPDLVITNNLKGIGYLTFVSLRRLNIKNIHILHDIQLIHPSGLIIYGKEKKLDTIFADLYSFLSRKICGSPEIIISPSKWLLSMHSWHGFFKKSKQFVLPNPIKINERQTLQFRGKEKFNKFLYVGEIKKHKGIEFLVSAFIRLLEDRKNIQLSIVGRDSEKISVPAEFAENFHLLGWKNAGEVKKEMNASDFLIVPSLCYENSPTVIYEAFASGLPVIASRIGGIGELIHSFGGILYKPGDEADLIKKIVYALKNPDIMYKIGIQASQNIKKYGIEKYLDAVEGELKKIN